MRGPLDVHTELHEQRARLAKVARDIKAAEAQVAVMKDVLKAVVSAAPAPVRLAVRACLADHQALIDLIADRTPIGPDDEAWRAEFSLAVEEFAASAG